MRAKEFIIVEYRDRLLQYVKSLLPNYPEYVLKDWLVPNKGNFSNLPDTELKNGIMEKLKGAGLTPNTKWQLVPDMKFTMDMFEPMTTKRLIGRAGGNSDMGLDVPRDKERHATQAALAQQQGGVRKEPVLLIKTDKGYELLEGWHRTIQHFAKYPDGYTGPAYVAVAQGQLSLAEGATVTRIDSKPITDFSSSLKAYKHTDDWSQSGLDTGDDSYWKNKNLKTNTTKGLFAGDPRRTALYATGNAHETRYVEFTQNGQPIVYFDQKDLPAIRSRKTYLTVFDASNFRQLPTGEWFSENPSKPIKQMPIGDPFKYIASQGWIVRVTDDLDKVFKQVKNMHKAGKIAQYGAEGMNESKQGVAENLRVDVPNEDWLNDAIAYAKKKSPDRNGLPYMGKTTATVRQVEVPVMLLRRIPGMRNEQQNVRYNDLAAIEKIMKDTGKLPIHSHSNEEYKPFINVAYDGSAWVNEGNHRIMAAYRLGWDSLPVEISYFDGGERVESGPMYPGKIGL